jgi:hypothetical protein
MDRFEMARLQPDLVDLGGVLGYYPARDIWFLELALVLSAIKPNFPFPRKFASRKWV